jgi:hypothetical protein
VAAQLVASRVVLSSTELVSYLVNNTLMSSNKIYINEDCLKQGHGVIG